MTNEPQEFEIEAKEGIIGYFDILGYKNYIQNDPDVSSKHALEVILKLKTKVPQKVKSRFSAAIDRAVFDEIKWSVLSDTIVLSIPYSQTIDSGRKTTEKDTRWKALIFSAVTLMDHMFDQGLPIRGAISYGKYFIHDNSLAGKSVIEAVALAEKLNLSAVAICPGSEKEFCEVFKLKSGEKKQFKSPAVFHYATPFKSDMQKLWVLNQWALHDNHIGKDIPQLVAQSFWQHGKDMDTSAFQKFQNTEMLLRYIVAMNRQWKI